MGMIIQAAEDAILDVEQKEKNDNPDQGSSAVKVTMKAEKDVSAAEVKEVCKESIVKSISLIEYLLSVRRALLEEEKAPFKIGILQVS